MGAAASIQEYTSLDSVRQAELKQRFETLVRDGKTEEEALAILKSSENGVLSKRFHSGQLLILDTDADPNEVLLNSVLPSTVVVRYDSDEDTAEDLTRMIRIAHFHNLKPFTHVALATHAGETWQICKDVTVPMMAGITKSVAAALPIMSELAGVVAKQAGRIDLLGCDILEHQPRFVEALEQLYGVNFAASDDKTGNMCGGGDWVLESDGIDVAGTYFDKARLAEFKGNLGWGSWLMSAADCVPIVGTVARTAQAGVLLAQGDTEGAKSAITDAALNAAGDAVGLVTGGTGKVAMTALKAGGKVVVKQGLKAAGKAAWKAAAKKLTKEAMKKYAKQYFKKKIKKALKEQAKKILKEGAEYSRDQMCDFLSDATGTSKAELSGLGKDQLNDLLNAVATTDDVE